jgi:hypothetical protein
VKLFEAGSTHDACEKFAESMKLDPANGTLQNLALCHEKEGKTASAWREFTELEERATRDHQAARERLGRDRAAALSPRLSRLSLSMQGDVTPAEIRVDGTPLARDTWANAIAIDPGEHSIALSAPGKKTTTLHVTVAAGPTMQTIVLAKLEDEEVPPGAPRSDEPAPAVAPSEGLGTQRVLAIVVASAGVAGVAVGSVFGIMASSKWSSAQSDCNPNCTSSSPAIGERSDAQNDATVATVAFVAGGAAIVAGAVLFFTAPTATKVAPLVGPGVSGLVVSGRF